RGGHQTHVAAVAARAQYGEGGGDQRAVAAQVGHHGGGGQQGVIAAGPDGTAAEDGGRHPVTIAGRGPACQMRRRPPGLLRPRRGFLGEAYGAEDLLHGRFRDLLLDALGAVQVPGDEVTGAVLEPEGDRLAVALALALLRRVHRVRRGDVAPEARRGGVGLRLHLLDALLVGLGVPAEDPPRHPGPGRLLRVLGTVLTAGSGGGEGGVLLAAVLV